MYIDVRVNIFSFLKSGLQVAMPAILLWLLPQANRYAIPITAQKALAHRKPETQNMQYFNPALMTLFISFVISKEFSLTDHDWWKR